MVDLTPFCGERNTHWGYSLNRVMTWEGWTYAVDGIIAVRRKALASEEPRKGDGFPTLLPGLFESRDWSAPTFPFPEHCGLRYEDEEVCACVVAFSPHPTCSTCGGTGLINLKRAYDMVIGRRTIAGNVVEKINLHLRSPLILLEGEARDCLAFIADGRIQGIIAPMKSSEHLAGE